MINKSENLEIVLPKNQLSLYGYENYFAAFANLYRKNKIATVIKHIPGHGLAKSDSHYKLPIIKAKKEELASSITIVFLLNLFAIIAFPFIGEAIGLTQKQFGIFAALTIHDTASVLGAASIFGNEALEIATIMKLGRTLWIIPLVLVSSWYFNRRQEGLDFPYFILLFALFVIAGSFFIFEDSWVLFFKSASKIFLSLVYSLLGRK